MCILCNLPTALLHQRVRLILRGLPGENPRCGLPAGSDLVVKRAGDGHNGVKQSGVPGPPPFRLLFRLPGASQTVNLYGALLYDHPPAGAEAPFIETNPVRKTRKQNHQRPQYNLLFSCMPAASCPIVDRFHSCFLSTRSALLRRWSHRRKTPGSVRGVFMDYDTSIGSIGKQLNDSSFLSLQIGPAITMLHGTCGVPGPPAGFCKIPATRQKAALNLCPDTVLCPGNSHAAAAGKAPRRTRWQDGNW